MIQAFRLILLSWIFFNQTILSVQRDWLASLLQFSSASRMLFLLFQDFLHIQCKVAESIFVQSCLNLFWNSRDCLASIVYRYDISWRWHLFLCIFSQFRSDIFKHFWFFFSLVSFVNYFLRNKGLGKNIWSSNQSDTNCFASPFCKMYQTVVSSCLQSSSFTTTFISGESCCKRW